MDLPLEAKAVLDSMVNIDAQLNELTFKEAEISKLFTKAHRRTARCWKNAGRWKMRKSKAERACNGDAENTAGNCSPDA